MIVHHIEEWSESRNHEPENLAVLCLEHHDQAHTKKTLSQNLSAQLINEHKHNWESEVKNQDAKNIRQSMRLEYSNWNYINELRLFELADELNLKLSVLRGFRQALDLGIINQHGIPQNIKNENDLFYKYEGTNIIPRYVYTKSVLESIISLIPITNVSDYLEKSIIGSAFEVGDFIFVQGAHTFSPLTKKKNGRGPGQICRGLRSANNINIQFTFDRWEATSSSAKNDWLSSTKNQGSLIQIKDATHEKGVVIVTGTVLGICSNFGDLKTRDYAKSWVNWIPKNTSFDEDFS